ncbi:hypothetical protein Pint_00385 [Pistacia integerrima]|uniref:Uncharacterized protein n=1 Tax=Pistacia integerrima TaxID=434235 RepID=A0ACC0ZKK5_9ROSI|nr:hypothetical protein Pint_00385 [Pistacia integerrima]
MEEAATKRYAVVTGANKGIGFGVCKQLTSHGITVVLTARDVRRGLEAVDKLREFGLSDHLPFHQLDVQDPASIAALANFIRNQFGKLDILVNNAGVGGYILDGDALRNSGFYKVENVQIDWSKIVTETYELAEECQKINYHGAKRTCEALIPLLQLSDSPKIVNVSSGAGKLKRHQTFRINCVCPGFVKTDINKNTGTLTIEEGAESLVRLALLPKDGPSGVYFEQKEESPF